MPLEHRKVYHYGHYPVYPDFLRRLQMSTTLDLLVPYKWQDDGGEERTGYTRVGVAWPRRNGEGFTATINDGICITGDLVAMPRQQPPRGKPE